jgi:hypothetical protein
MCLNVLKFGEIFPEFPINAIEIGKAVANGGRREFEVEFLAKSTEAGHGRQIGPLVRIRRLIEGDKVVGYLNLLLAPRFRRNPHLYVFVLQFGLTCESVSLGQFLAAQFVNDPAGLFCPALGHTDPAFSAHPLPTAVVTDIYAGIGSDFYEFFPGMGFCTGAFRLKCYYYFAHPFLRRNN